MNYFDAEERCSEDGAHLMILNTTKIIYFMQEWLRAGMYEYKNSFYSNNDTVKRYHGQMVNNSDLSSL